jgi:EpsI family protein
LYLIWAERKKFSAQKAQPNFIALLFLVLTCGLWFVSQITNTVMISQIAIVLIIIMFNWAVLGTSVVKKALFPLCFLFLAVQIWNPIESILQFTTVKVVTTLLLIFDVPTFVQGPYISVPAGEFYVEEVCAGLRYILAALAISSLFAHLYFRLFKTKTLFVAIAVLLALAANWIRVFTVIYAGQISNMTHPIVHSHVTYGWIVYSLSLIPLFFIGSKFQKLEKKAKDSTTEKMKGTDNTRVSYKNFNYVLSITITMLVMPVAGMALLNSTGTQKCGNCLSLPANINSWKKESMTSDWRPLYKGADVELLSNYEKDGVNILLYIAQYQQQSQGKELINELNGVYDRDKWLHVGTKTKTITISKDDGEPLTLRETIVRNGSGKMKLVWYWYYVGGVVTSNPIKAKLLQVWDVIFERNGSSVIALAADYGEPKAEAEKTLKLFIEDLLPDIYRDSGLSNEIMSN